MQAAPSLGRRCGDWVENESCHLFTEIMPRSLKIKDSFFSDSLYLMSRVHRTHYLPCDVLNIDSIGASQSVVRGPISICYSIHDKYRNTEQAF